MLHMYIWLSKLVTPLQWNGTCFPYIEYPNILDQPMLEISPVYLNWPCCNVQIATFLINFSGYNDLASCSQIETLVCCRCHFGPTKKVNVFWPLFPNSLFTYLFLFHDQYGHGLTTSLHSLEPSEIIFLASTMSVQQIQPHTYIHC